MAITARALEAVARAVAAGHLGVAASDVGVTLRDRDGRLAVRVDAPLGVTTGGPGILTRVGEARTTIARDVTRLTGSQIGSVDIRITAAHITKGPRVS
ncbi:hypothetical protein LH407_04540 [Antiquaquibacter oligotrophicus]|uniref:hypothetical protein n=1 Tax=Antiquaquibacter oligotrophicus TaxID=2880260 RepID=UPI002AC930D1|nr:hypothetical protein [Antiquaquibacter oligotrophicus]UDF14131.1 hypothetical protein LH407_04540 [Antiquaquibacter oligotrophicus]